MFKILLCILSLSVCNLNAEVIELNLQKQESYSTWILSAFMNGKYSSDKEIRAIAELKSYSAIPDKQFYKPELRSAVTYTFDGLKISAIENNETKNLIVFNITISKPKWSLSTGIKIGDPVTVLSNIPIPEHADKKNSFCGYDNCVTFDIKNGNISMIELSLYAG